MSWLLCWQEEFPIELLIQHFFCIKGIYYHFKTIAQHILDENYECKVV